jgi:O-succinylbenzoic acid--CoA ligase
MIYLSREKDLINFKADDNYFNRVKEFILLWESGVEKLEVQTSGSTGISKKIELSRKQLLASVNQTKKAFYLNEENLFICNLSIDFIAGKLMIIRALELSAELIIVSPEGDFIENLGLHKYTIQQHQGHNIFAFVPLQMYKILESEEGVSILNTAKAILIGGANTGSTLLKKIKELKVPVYATYGMTESVTHAAIKRLNGDKPEIYYSPLEATEIKLDSRGCLCLKNEATDNNWLITNDLVHIKENGQFKLLGRIDDIINSGGVKLNLHEIETKIEELLNTSIPFFCYGIPDEKLGQKLILCLEQKSKDERLLDRLKSQLPKFEAPKELYFIENFVKTSSGKIDKTKSVDAYSVSNQ